MDNGEETSLRGSGRGSRKHIGHEYRSDTSSSTVFRISHSPSRSYYCFWRVQLLRMQTTTARDVGCAFQVPANDESLYSQIYPCMRELSYVNSYNMTYHDPSFTDLFICDPPEHKWEDPYAKLVIKVVAHAWLPVIQSPRQRAKSFCMTGPCTRVGGPLWPPSLPYGRTASVYVHIYTYVYTSV